MLCEWGEQYTGSLYSKGKKQTHPKASHTNSRGGGGGAPRPPPPAPPTPQLKHTDTSAPLVRPNSEEVAAPAVQRHSAAQYMAPA
jgi:hypothetical protein